jgi:tetratricopeptide (TPR) repeat protein
MSDECWHRRRTWTPDDEAAFFARLRRSRGAFHKAQYCRIQAYELQVAGNYSAALALLELLMREWSEEALKAAVYHQKANCLERLGQQAAAIDAYRAAFDAQRKEPGMMTSAHLDFGWLVVTAPCLELYEEALDVLEEFVRQSSFPIDEFREAAIRAFIWSAKGDRERSRRNAQAALDAMARRHSGFARHPDLGLVQDVEPIVAQRLQRLAAASV